MSDKSPCKGCPEFLSLEGEHIIFVYTGGDPNAVYARVRHAIRPDTPGIERRWKSPSVLEDGSIQYDKSDPWPPPVLGYSSEPGSPHKLTPHWPTCVWRSIDVFQDDTGLLVLHFMCINPAHGGGGPGVAEVSPSECRSCKIRKETL